VRSEYPAGGAPDEEQGNKDEDDYAGGEADLSKGVAAGVGDGSVNGAYLKG